VQYLDAGRQAVLAGDERRMRASSMWLALRSLVWTIALPGTVAGFIPWLYFGIDRMRIVPSDPAHLAGLALIAVGAALLGACILEFARSGKGTLSPADPPRHLVVRGLYRYVRNPMYLAVSTIVLGEALWARSMPLVWYWLVFFTCCNLFVIGYEEPYLRSRFGPEYEAYTRSVARWIPGDVSRR
jgi:protein-S-isoprenylcysteine O-methyltransferase Ste14